MTKEELLLAFRMIAMGRPNTPHTEQLADFLLSLSPAPVVEAEAPQVAQEAPKEPTTEKRGRKAKAD
jgi:hypothetical protein